ncbi:MAG: galactose mutarotase [Negativicutes bacterium]|nr:galactose mutarotase [Negativicutes bacterium]
MNARIFAWYKGLEVREYELLGSGGFSVRFLNYGGIITAIRTPDRTGELANVVLTAPEFDPENTGHLGAITGRVAGRIADARFNLDGVEYRLTANSGRHNLHGGPVGLNRRFWQVEPVAAGARLTCHSPDRDQGFPGAVDFAVDYEIVDQYCLRLTYRGTCRQPTVLNLTNHSYFDLTGGSDPMSMYLEVEADHVATLAEHGCVDGRLVTVAGTPFDFRRPRQLAGAVNADFRQFAIANGGIDHPFLLTGNRTIVLSDRSSGRYLRVITDQPCCVVYTANWYQPKHAAVCLETQCMPNAINWPQFRDTVIFGPDRPYFGQTTWQFGVMCDG